LTVPLIAYIDFYSYTAPVCAAILMRSWRTREGRLFLAFVFVNTASEVLGYILAHRGVHNYWVVHVDTLLAFIVVVLLFILWEKDRAITKLLQWIIVLYALFWLILQLTIEPWSVLPQYISTVSSVVFTAIALKAIYTLLHRGEDLRLFKDARFWWSCGILLNYAGNFVVFLFENQILVMSSLDAGAFWSLHWYLSAIFNVFLTVSLLCLKTK
jgi:hypothetical protein